MESERAPENPMHRADWTGPEVQREFQTCANLRDVIQLLEARRSVLGEVICEVRVNGLLLREEDEARFADSPRAEIESLSILYARSSDLILQALCSVAEFLPNLERSCLETSEAIRDGGLGAAQKRFREIIEGCQWAVETLLHSRGAASGIGAPLSQPERWYEAEKTLNQTVRELTEAYRARDAALVADILEYEATAAAGIWVETLEREMATRRS